MLLEGVVRNGKIELEPPQVLPEGTRVHVELQEEAAFQGLMQIVGTARDLPPDFADQHDHYIHGTPKR